MSDRERRQNVRVEFEPERPEAMLESVRREVAKRNVDSVTLDLQQARYLGPNALEALALASAAACSAGKTLLVERVPPTVYKALHIAKLDGLLQRA